ncbi:MAG: class I SAM-dependent methyltransferase [Patescibacteria group bacterium]|jgi:SAM-dependent methyltransferase
MSKVEQQAKHFKSVSEKYFTSRQLPNHLLLKDLMWGHFLKRHQSIKKDQMLVLEPLCGYGEGKEILEDHLKTKVVYEGFDISEFLVEAAQKKHPDSRIFVGDATTFKPTKKYDLIIVIGGLHHVPDYVETLMASLSDGLNKGGYFIALEPTQNNRLFKRIRAKTYQKNDFFDEETERAFDLKDLNKLMSDHRLEVIDQMYPGLLSYILFYNPDVFPWLNIGGKWLVKASFAVDKLFMRNLIGRKLSFATLTLARKVD